MGERALRISGGEIAMIYKVLAAAYERMDGLLTPLKLRNAALN